MPIPDEQINQYQNDGQSNSYYYVIISKYYKSMSKCILYEYITKHDNPKSKTWTDLIIFNLFDLLVSIIKWDMNLAWMI